MLAMARLATVATSCQLVSLLRGAAAIASERLILGTGHIHAPQPRAFSLWVPVCCCVAATEGCNFLDTANVYKEGWSEGVVGRFLKGRRDQFILTTKVGATLQGGGPGTSGVLRRARIVQSIEESLARLSTEYIDLYLCHFPDNATPLDETLGAMDELVRQGKVRFPGCSNFESWRLCESLQISEQKGLSSFVCDEVCYSLLDRRMEDELLPFAQRRRVSVTVFAVTAIGLLSGRCRYGQPPPEGTSWHRGPYNFHKAMTPRTGRVIDTVVDIAERRGKTPTQVAMAWCLQVPGITSVIIGADTPQRIEENFGAIGWTLSDEERKRLDEVTEGQRLMIHKDAPQGYQPAES